MKTIALFAAAGSLAAITAPATAAEMPIAHGSTMTAPMQQDFANLPMSNAIQHAGYHDDWRDRRDRRRWRDRDRDWDDDRRGRYRGEYWRDRDGRLRCRRDDGTTGLLVGAGVGALIGRTIDTRGDRTVGTLLGGALGAVIGREVDRREVRCR